MLSKRPLLSILSTRVSLMIQLVMLAVTMSVTLMLTVNSTNMLLQSVTESRKEKLIQAIISFIFCYLLNVLSTYMLNRLKILRKLNAERSMKGQIYAKLQGAGLSKLKIFAAGDLLTRYNDVTENIIQYAFEHLVGFVSDITLLILVIVYIGLNNMLLLLVLCIIPPVIIIVNHSSRKSSACFKQ